MKGSNDMPYSNIVFIKLFLSLFEEDDRFLYQLNESQQLLYVKMLYLAAISGNKITKNYRFICHKINYSHEESCLSSDLKRISNVFPRFIDKENYYYFEGFEELHNYIGKSKGNPKEIQRNDKGSDQSKNRVRIEKDKAYEREITETFEYFLLKTGCRFKINDVRKSLIKKRLQDGFTVEQFKIAIDNFIKDDWPDRKKYMDLVYVIGIRNKTDNLEKWLNKSEFKQNEAPRPG